MNKILFKDEDGFNKTKMVVFTSDFKDGVIRIKLEDEDGYSVHELPKELVEQLIISLGGV